MPTNRRYTGLTRSCLLLAFLLVIQHAYADSTQVVFFNSTWKGVLSEAKRLNKPIFLDLYTTWCAPCKRMEKEAFPNPEVARMFNANFVNYRVDAERGEGKVIRQQYDVTQYPTLLFLNAAGSVIYRTAGYSDNDELIQRVTNVLTVSKRIENFGAVGSPAEELKNPTRLKAYLLELAKLRQPVGQLLNAYVASLLDDQLTSPENLSIMAGTVSTTESKAFDVLLQQFSTLKALSLDQNALATMSAAVNRDFTHALNSDDEQTFLKLSEKHRSLRQKEGRAAPSEINHELANQQLDFYRQTKRDDQYHRLASFYAATQLLNLPVDSLRHEDQVIFAKFIKHVIASDSLRQTADFKRLTEFMKHRVSNSVAERLTKLADDYQASMTNPAYLNEALTWSQRAVLLYPIPFYRKTYAQLLYKTGHRNEAIREQQQVIEAASELRDPTEELEKTLILMRSGKL